MNAKRTLALLFPFTLAMGLQAQSDFEGVAGIRGSWLGYSTEAIRERLVSGGAFLDLDRRDTGGFHLSADHDTITFREGPTLNQDNILAGGRIYLPLGEGRGKVILQGDIQRVTFQEAGSAKQTANVSGVHLGYLSDIHPELAGFHLDLGFIQSRYDGGLRAEQWSPTLGFGVNGNLDWFTLGVDAITVKGPGAPQARTSAVRGSWTHFFLPGAALKPKSIYLTALGGERLYAADMGLGIVYTLGDYQTSRWSLGSTWGGLKGLGFTLEAGASRFESRTATATIPYTTRFAAASIHFTW